MSEVKGKLCSCDRCGTKIFLKTTGEGEADGGFTRWNNFEPYPTGWSLVAVPAYAKTGNSNVYNSYMHVCPACHAIWDKVVNEGFLRGTDYYHIEEG